MAPRSIPGIAKADAPTLLAGEDEIAAEAVAVVVAHPDDEMIGCGAQLARLRGVTVVHVTDGAPRDMQDGGARGFETPAAYAAARRRELEAAVALAGIGPEALLGLDVPDQQAALHLASLSRRLAALFAERGITTALTHAYEGGHPDHDAVAFAVHAAREWLRAFPPPGWLRQQPSGEGRVARSATGAGVPAPALDRLALTPPSRSADADSTSPKRGEGSGMAPSDALTIIEMPLYHASPSGWVTQRFIPDPQQPEWAVPLTDAQRALKQRMMAAHATQAATLSAFTSDIEPFRLAPDYDFTLLPNGGDLLYERYDWGLTGARWQALVRAALEELRLERAA